MKSLPDKLRKRQEQGILRSLQSFDGCIDFLSNDYLGMCRNTHLEARISEVLDNQKLLNKNGSGGSRLLSGNLPFYEQTEQWLAHYFNAESALVFGSGYAANLGLLSCLPGKADTVIYDEWIHASARDGLRLSVSKNYSFKHNDLNDLRQKLQKADADVYVLVESVYSMDGDFAPLAEIQTMQKEFGFTLIVDEAHAAGIFGIEAKGFGFSNEMDENLIRIITFGKAYGVEGACVLGTAVLREYLLNFSRPFIYSTAPSPHFFASVHASVEQVADANHERSALMRAISYFKEQFEPYFPCTQSAVQVFIPGSLDRLKQLALAAKHHNLALKPVYAPTVPEGQERLRIVLHSYNSTEEIDLLKQILTT